MRLGRRIRRASGIAFAAALTLALPSGAQDAAGAMVEWPAFGNGPDNTKYSALADRKTTPRLVALALP